MKIILLVFIALMIVGCDMPMDKLPITTGDKYIITSKTKKVNESIYGYKVIKLGELEYYDYLYKDSINFSVGDTIMIIVRKFNN